MNTVQRTLAVRIGLTAALLLGTAGAALARDVTEQDVHAIGMGSSKAEIRSLMGEPLREIHPLFSSSDVWLYYVEGSAPGDERAVQVIFDAQGRVQSTYFSDAAALAVDRYE